MWNPYLDRWLMTYLKEGEGVVLREGLAPWGPWGDPIDLVGASEQPGLYAPFMNDRYTADGGRTVYFMFRSGTLTTSSGSRLTWIK